MLDQQAVNDGFDGVVAPLVELDLFVERDQLAVNARAQEAVLAELLQLLLELALAAAHDGREHHHALAFGQREDAVDDLLDRLARDGRAADVDSAAGRGGEEEAEVVVDFRHRADGRARAARDGLLLDGDGGREAVNRVDVGAFELVEELPGVGREGFDVAALALGVDGVEGERRFARAERPVMTVRRSRGISTLMFFRLCWRAPRTVMRSIAIA